MIARDTLSLGDELATSLNGRADVDDVIRVSGRVELELTRPDGTVEVTVVENLITTAGRNMIADRLLAAPALGVPTHMGVGTGNVAAALGDTALTGETRVALTSKTRATNVVTFVGDYAAGVATGALTEAGLWDANAAGILDARAVFGVINKAAADTLKVTWTWTIG